MVLQMARPQLHPRSGFFWFRKRVPTDLVEAVGRREVYFSLKTRDPAVAKRRHAEEAAKLEAQWAALRTGTPPRPASGPADVKSAEGRPPRRLTEREAHEHAVWLYRMWVDRFREHPSQQMFWPTHLYEHLWPDLNASLRILSPGESPPPQPIPHPEWQRLHKLERWCLDHADDLIAIHELTVDEDDRLRLAKAVGSAIQRASLLLAQFAEGDFRDDPAVRPAAAPAKPETASARPPVTFDVLLKGWAAERRPAPKTLYEWSRVVRQFASHAGHDDATQITPETVVGWKEALIAKGLKPKTISDGHLTALRTVLQWGADNHRITGNPAERIVIDVKKVAAESIRGFTEEEAARVLRAALGEKNPVLRWVPWLCAYSGARVSEVCQLRAEDICQIEGIWCMKFDPEAGPLKTASSERAVPLHPAILDSGLLSYVEGIKSGPLFPRLPPDKFGKRGGNGTKVLGRWVRKLGLTDPRIAPNHSWRHRLKTLGRRLGLAPDIVDAITGHGKRTVADAYGEFEMAALQRELRKVPILAITIADVGPAIQPAKPHGER